MREQRYSSVPWLNDADLSPAGVPETVVEIANDEIALGMVIRNPFGRGTDTMVTVHAFRRTGVILLAERDSIQVDTFTIEPAQSNPHRHDTGED